MEDLVRVTEQWDGDEGEQGFPPLLCVITQLISCISSFNKALDWLSHALRSESCKCAIVKAILRD